MNLLFDSILSVSAGQLLEDGEYAGYVLPAHEEHSDQEMERNFARVMAEAYEIFCQRHEGYGRGNISQIGLKGVVSRLTDKFERLKRRVEGAQSDTALERGDDVLIDLANYALIALLLRRGIWPVEAQQPRMLSEVLYQALYDIIVARGADPERAHEVAGEMAACTAAEVEG